MDLCPCHSNQPYETCCKKFHKKILPTTPVELMRSRYSAYALNNANYIIDTTHKESPHYLKNKTEWKKEILIFCKSTQFQNLEIINESPLTKTATVTFIATLTQNSHNITFTEKSTFKKVGKKWLYVSGVKEDGRHFDL
ncbi:MAG: hypothetical protein S4CHLAM37_15400 [Chlamydiia bacterium]|nr:hypothetical protein [Chlamydiia bacterium]